MREIMAGGLIKGFIGALVVHEKGWVSECRGGDRPLELSTSERENIGVVLSDFKYRFSGHVEVRESTDQECRRFKADKIITEGEMWWGQGIRSLECSKGRMKFDVSEGTVEGECGALTIDTDQGTMSGQKCEFGYGHSTYELNMRCDLLVDKGGQAYPMDADAWRSEVRVNITGGVNKTGYRDPDPTGIWEGVTE